MKLFVTTNRDSYDSPVIRQLLHQRVKVAVRNTAIPCEQIQVHLDYCKATNVTQCCRIQFVVTSENTFEVKSSSHSIVESIFEATQKLEQTLSPQTAGTRCQ